MSNQLSYLNNIQNSANQLRQHYGDECARNFMENVSNSRRQTIASAASWDAQYVALYGKYPNVDYANTMKELYVQSIDDLRREDLSLRFYDC